MMPMFAVVRDWNQFGNDLIYAATFGLLGIAMLLLGFKLFELVTPTSSMWNTSSKKATSRLRSWSDRCSLRLGS